MFYYLYLYNNEVNMIVLFYNSQILFLIVLMPYQIPFTSFIFFISKSGSVKNYPFYCSKILLKP